MERRVGGARNSNFIWKANRLRRWWTNVPKNHLTRVRIQASFVLKGGVWLVVAGIICSYSCPCRSGHNVPINLQQDIYYFLFCNFLFLYEWKSIIPLKIRALRMGYHVYFTLQAIFRLQRCRACMTKHRQQSTRVKAKGIDPIWSQVCSSLLQL